MKRFGLILLLSFCISCGSNDASFPGVWDGTLTLNANDCPFDGPADQNQIFPIAVTEPNGQLFVVAANGNSGPAEVEADNSFVVTAPVFGSVIGNTGAYVGCVVSYQFGLYSGHDSSAKSSMFINYNCTNSTNGNQETCAIAYAGEASKR